MVGLIFLFFISDGASFLSPWRLATRKNLDLHVY